MATWGFFEPLWPNWSLGKYDKAFQAELELLVEVTACFYLLVGDLAQGIREKFVLDVLRATGLWNCET